MKAEYSNLFKEIVYAYYNGNFEEKVKNILSKPDINKKDLARIISSLCGVELTFTDNYIDDLKKAVKNYKAEHKIVTKIRTCSMDCADTDGTTACKKSCPFDAIIIDQENHTSFIDKEKCTDCGFCVEGCPTGSILDKVEFIPFVNLLKEKVPVIAAVAPAIQGQFGSDVSIYKLRSAFKKIGFTEMVEVAFFADMLTLKEAVEFDEHVHTKDDFMITSCCCPMWVAALKRVYKDLVKHVSPSVSPMIAAGRVMKTLNPNCKVVFIGPCIAKKAEAKEKDLLGDIDYVLTFAEVKDIFNALNINPKDMKEDYSTEYASMGGRLYGRTGGVSKAVSDAIERLFPEKFKMLTTTQANGMVECKKMLSEVQEGNIRANFIEGMGCIGGCVGGPKAIIPKDEGRDSLNEFAYNSEIKVSVDSDTMKNILNRLGINSAEDFKHKEKCVIFERHF
ncbi:4Fe-4S binding protein [Clostridium sp. SYSU_GA19001]|uniref:[Fe-Fe] hydrogenase large subunit C-terminal domain-containing protein n=1 Tax=Clostridium caldaquaticum TaxID=2940653 RepID=UPI002076FAC7|nr:[Fe-Fe] hydrogenase large subunit C-terminal domain-containing protein [Clostridium caldaquaticum]MCM8709497.1 4Fe-4S binding protein [Clostridium caldaquaticum]